MCAWPLGVKSRLPTTLPPSCPEPCCFSDPAGQLIVLVQVPRAGVPDEGLEPPLLKGDSASVTACISPALLPEKHKPLPKPLSYNRSSGRKVVTEDPQQTLLLLEPFSHLRAAAAAAAGGGFLVLGPQLTNDVLWPLWYLSSSRCSDPCNRCWRVRKGQPSQGASS